MADDTTPAETREIIYHCEECSIPLYEGDRAYVDAERVALCEEHSPRLSEAIRQWEDLLPDWIPGAEDFDTREELEAHIASMRADLAANGDRKLVSEV